MRKPMVFAVATTTAMIVFSSIAQAQMACRHIFMSAAVEKLGLSMDPLDQMMTWEQTSNTKRWEKPTPPAEIEVSLAPADSVVIRQTSTPGSVMNAIVGKDGQVRFPRHPWNTDKDVPHFNDAAVEKWKMRYSASRSMFLYSPKGDFYSVKMPTSRPHGDAHPQPTKSDLKNSVIISHRRSFMIEQVDKRIEADPQFEVLLDVVSVADKTTGNGYVVRDLRGLQDGNYYLPAFSVPYAGKQIAEATGVSYEKLFAEHWGASLGRSKAMLLLNYGLQMKTPNAQNMLIQFDKNLQPTGKMIFRDISDSSLVGPVAEGLKLGEYVKADRESKYAVYEELKPNWDNSAWQMDEGGVSKETLARWGREHDDVYVETIVEALRQTPTGAKLFADFGAPLPKPKKGFWISVATFMRIRSEQPQVRLPKIQDLQQRLFSAEGKQALGEFRDLQFSNGK